MAVQEDEPSEFGKPKQMKGKRSNAWCFTLNNYTPDELAFLRALDHNNQVRFLVFGREMGEKTHTPHLQGYIYFHNQKYRSEVIKFMHSNRFRYAPAKGSADQNIAYCTKQDTEYVMFGDKPSQGSRSDIKAIREAFERGDRVDRIIWDANSYQSARHAELLMRYRPMPPSQKRLIKWYWGPSGTGKTYTAEQESLGDYWISLHSLRWWDGYTGQKYVIIDDMRGDFCTFHEFLRIIDRYPYRVEFKGGSTWLQPSTEVIIVTSCFPPEKMWVTIEDKSQLLRRLDEVREFGLPVLGLANYKKIKLNLKKNI